MDKGDRKYFVKRVWSVSEDLAALLKEMEQLKVGTAAVCLIGATISLLRQTAGLLEREVLDG